MAREITGVGVKPSSLLDHGLHAVAREDLERRALGGAGEGVRILAEKERPVDLLRAPVVADRLRHREDVGLVEGAAQRGAAVAAGAEAHALGGIVRIRPSRIVLALERGDVHEHFARRGLAGQG
jgi:hypothetical protein